jgi:integrase
MSRWRVQRPESKPLPVPVVSERLGHSKVSMTMEVYAHVLPDMQQDAAGRIGALLHG